MSALVQFALQATTGTLGTAMVILAQLLGLALLAGLLAAIAALLYRWYVGERVPAGLSLLFGLAGVALVLNTSTLLAAQLSAESSVELVGAMFNVAAFVGAAAGAGAGTRVGDAISIDFFSESGREGEDRDLSAIVQSVGRVTTVTLPRDIDDVVGYDPVSPATKEELAGRRFLFPKRLTRAELRDRLTRRLHQDYGVGHVDVEFGADGSVTYLAVGARAAGIGPTLPAATNAVAIRADPAHAASAGDLVQVWDAESTQRVLTGELRGVAGDVVTIAIDAADTPKLNPTKRYKLVTLPVEDRPDREFAALLRAAEETLATVTVGEGSKLDGATVDSLGVTVAAITSAETEPEPLPVGERALAGGETIYMIGKPPALRRIEAAGEPPESVEPAEDMPSARGEQSGTTAADSAAGDATTAAESGPADSTVSAGPDAAESEAEPPADADAEPSAADGADSAPAAPDEDTAEATDGEAEQGVADDKAFPDTDDLAGIDTAEAVESMEVPSADDDGDPSSDDGSPAADDADSDDTADDAVDLDELAGQDSREVNDPLADLDDDADAFESLSDTAEESDAADSSGDDIDPVGAMEEAVDDPAADAEDSSDGAEGAADADRDEDPGAAGGDDGANNGEADRDEDPGAEGGDAAASDGEGQSPESQPGDADEEADDSTGETDGEAE
jgi:hypothetical protein